MNSSIVLLNYEKIEDDATVPYLFYSLIHIIH
jgi:hypothetical protein